MPRKYYGRRKRAARATRRPRVSRPRALRRKLGLNPRTHNFARSTRDSVVINGPGFGQVAWSSAPLNWQIGTPTPDDNGLWQFGGSMKFQLSDVINTIDFTTLFDRYKLNKVVVSIMPLMSMGHNIVSSATGTNQSSCLPTLVTAIDYDDATVPTLSDDLLERQNCKSYRMGGKVINITINNPKVLQSVASGDTTVTQVSAVTKAAPYLDCVQEDVNHYGLKFYVRDFALPAGTSAPSPSSNSLLRIRCKYYLSFKESK